MQNINDAGDISEEVRNSLDGEGKLRSVQWGEKKILSAVVLPCFSLFYHTVEAVNAAADNPYWNVSFCY
jgi:hypothetical protein